MYDTVLVATDGSPAADRAVGLALDFADRFDAAVHALTVVDADTVEATPDSVREDLRNALDEHGHDTVSALADLAESVETTVRTGRPGTEIVAHAREIDADCVAPGTRGRHGPARFRVGSVAEHVVRTCPAPVLTVRSVDGG
jgi:nucleotide-binding universal stress UspA family protein